MKEIELVDKRGLREKHFLQENGEFRAEMYDDDIHYIKNNKYEEIDNTLILENNHYTNRSNDCKMTFTAISSPDLMKIEKNNHYIKFLLNSFDEFEVKQEESMSKLVSKIKYINVLKNIDICYDLVSSRVKESIYINDKDSDIDKLIFDIDTDMELVLDDDSIKALFDNKCIFEFGIPFMMDSNGNINKNVKYELIKNANVYKLKMILDNDWLNSNVQYPIIIDPTITNYNDVNSVIDTYIYPNDTNVDRNSHPYLKVGVERVNNVDIINRTLIKFSLPTIGTGSQIIQASLNLNGYPISSSTNNQYILDVYRLTSDWQENSANWNNMNNNYDSSRIEAVYKTTQFYNYYANGYVTSAFFDLTNLVKKWYTDTPNYGIMIKENKEIYKDGIIPLFYSKNPNTSGDDPKPVLSITYRNQNGLEKYMNYDSQKFARGKIYQNNYNGNMVSVFDICSTVGSKMPIDLKWICNTNDVILNNNFGLGIGAKFNYYQTIEVASEIDNEDIEYLKYYDEDGTIHYFPNKRTTVNKDQDGFYNPSTTTYTNEYYDEDGLQLKIVKYDNYYLMTDKNNNEMKFMKNNNIGYLTEINSVDGSQIIINYDSTNRLVSITDNDTSTINISYTNNSVVVTNSNDVTTLNISGNNLTSISNNFGEILFTYNANHLIESVRDLSGKKMLYEYYSEVPYRVKKVSEYGVDNTLGNSYEITYGYNATTLIDSHNKSKTITFNDFGNPVSISTLKNHNDITNAYGIKLDYNEFFEGSTLQNKLLNNQVPLKYVRNYLSDSSFESGSVLGFVTDSRNNLSISNDCANSGNKSLKINCGSYNKPVYRSFSLPKGYYYTFSGYFNTGGKEMVMILSYMDSTGQEPGEYSEFFTTTDFERQDVTIYYPEDATSDLELYIWCHATGDYYLDDIQLEQSEVVNNYNMLENSGFENGTTGWTLIATDENNNNISSSVFEIVNVVDVTKALKIKCDPSNSSRVYQSFNIKGKQGDKFTISFWYKNEGFIGGYGLGDITRNNVQFNFNPVEQQQTDLMVTSNFNPNEKEWQYFSYTVEAPWDFDGMSINFWQELNANSLYITNLNLFKDVRSVTYEYDSDGKIIASKGLNNEETSFKYDSNNQLIKVTNPIGRNFVYEYDNEKTNRVLRAISETGISNEIKYDSNGNPIITRIVNKYQNNPLNGGMYEIRIKGTDNYVGMSNNELLVINENHKHNIWYVEKVTIDSNDFYKISHSIASDKYLTANNTNIVLSAYNSNLSLFELIKNDNNSYLLKNKNNSKYLKYENNNLILADYIDGNYNYEFYFENNFEGKFIENGIEYTQDGKFAKCLTDTLMRKTYYDIDENTGLINSIINPKGIKTSYEYNLKRQITKITTEDNFVNYEYNSNGLISKITQGDKEYNIEYDTFLNVKNIKINNNTLVTNTYEQNNGNLISSTYGNNDSISYTYDDFNRIKSIIKMDDTYNCYYDNNGNLAKVKSSNDTLKYVYDSSKRLYKYSFNNFIIKYGYDICNNIISLNYNLNYDSYNVNNIIGSDGLITRTSFDDFDVNYIYDSLSRVANTNIDGSFNISYEYESNGYRTSQLIKSINNNGDIYSYKYDKNDNITHIYHNNQLENHYYYDCYDELIREDNYLLNQTVRYKYDKNGNILFKKIYEMDTYNQLSQDIYEYSNSNWKDQLTKFNNISITYDSVGNPLTIGNATLTWINGRQLNSYSDSQNTINYEYNKDGIRTKKTVNNVTTQYLLRENEIIIENRAGNMLYYLRNDIDDLIGFIYNNTKYYYIKNNQNDIIGIMDNNFNKVAEYSYDSWGNIVSIVDGNGIDVSNNSNHIANINPFRYRSYYYDDETKYYYLNSRYYNPEWGRFINADNSINSNLDILSHNLYIYCGNNPVNKVDENGNGWKELLNGITKAVTKAVKKAVETLIIKPIKTVVYVVTHIKEAFTLSAGYGIGADIGTNIAKAGYYNDRTIQIQSGKIETGSDINIGVKASMSNGDVGINREYFHTPHYVDGDFDESINHTQYMPLIGTVKDCEHTQVTTTFGFASTNNAGLDIDDSQYFIGLDISAHIGVGGHLKIGFNIPWSIY